MLCNFFNNKYSINFVVGKIYDMSNPNIDLVVKLEEKIEQLIQRYRTEKEKNSILTTEVETLTGKLEEVANDHSDLKRKFDKLKMAKTLEVSSEDVHDTKLRINQLVREIDKCISLLNR